MILADTSAWIDFLTGADTSVAARLRDGIRRQELLVIDPVLMEVMSGARRGVVDRTRRLLEAQHIEIVEPRLDWMDAAEIYRELRWRGITIRSQFDALIAAVAIRLDVALLHRDRDYEQIAQHTSLQLVEP